MAVNTKQYDLVIDGTEKQMYYSRVFINNAEIPSPNILSLVIRQWCLIDSYIPRLELIINDDGLISELFVPVEGTKILIELGRSAESESIIEAEFEALDYQISTSPNPNDLNRVLISAVLKTNNMFNQQTKTLKGNSKSALSTIATDMGLNFISDTTGNDSMKWLQLGKSNFKMIKHITEKSYITNDDVLLTYIDINKNLNYRSLKNCFRNPAYDLRFDIELATSVSLEEMEKLRTQKGIEFNQKDVWFGSIDILNYSGTLNNIYGYGITNEYYDIDKLKLISKSVNDVDKLISTDDDIKTLYNKTVNGIYNGIIDDQDNNVHSFYNIAEAIRANILSSFMAQSVLVEINSFSDVNVCDALNLHLPSNIKDNELSINETMSGKYLVGGLLYLVSAESILKKQLVLHRIGINKQGLV